MKHTKEIIAICVLGLVLATIVTFDSMKPDSLFQWWPGLVATVVGGIAVIACWGMYTGQDRETRRRLLPFCILPTVQTISLPLCDVCLLLSLSSPALLSLGFFLLSDLVSFLFILVYPFCIRMNRILWITAAVFAVNLLIQTFLSVMILAFFGAG